MCIFIFHITFDRQRHNLFGKPLQMPSTMSCVRSSYNTLKKGLEKKKKKTLLDKNISGFLELNCLSRFF